MTSAEILYLLPYLASLALSVGVLWYAWRHRHNVGGTTYVWCVAGQTLSIAGFILELTNPNLGVKIFWDKLEWVSETILVVSFFLFAVAFTGVQLPKPKLSIGFVAALPLLFIFLVFTDPLHHLIYPNPHFTTDYPFPDLSYSFTLPVYIYSIYFYLVTLGGIAILIAQIFHPQRIFASQILVLIIGFLIPVLFSVLAILNIQITPQRDATPITFAIGNLIVAWGLYRYRLFDVVPVARDTVIEHLQDPVVVLDLQDRIVDLNPATLAILGTDAHHIIGRPAVQVFHAWQNLFSKFSSPADLQTEISTEVNGVLRHYDIRVSLVRNRRGQVIGRTFTVIDMTERLELQRSLQTLNQKLEERVREQTRELVDAYDTTLEGWAKALELRDKETEGHTRRVTELTLRLAEAAGVSDQDLIHIRRGALLHDIGKMALPDAILLKHGPLTPAEREIVNEHPSTAYALLSPIHFLEPAMDIPYNHHEKWDGSGYPRGLRGKEIPLAARIFAIADVWDAIQSNRPYNKAWSRDKALEYIQAQAGNYFDPALVELFLDLIRADQVTTPARESDLEGDIVHNV